MFLFKSATAQHDLVQETYYIPAQGGLKLSFSHFDGYSPMLDGAVRVTAVDTPKSEKSDNITVNISVKASSPTYQYNVRVLRKENEIEISTGGLSLLQSMTAPRLIIEVAISLPHSVGDLDISTLSLPIVAKTVEKGGDIVFETESSSITVDNIDARSLTASTKSGSITFEALSEQRTDKFIKINNSSGSTGIKSSLFSPLLKVGGKSGSIQLSAKTSAAEFHVENTSGSISGTVGYSTGETSVSSYENGSGSLSVTLRDWSGFLAAHTGSGSKSVKGSGLVRENDGWKKGDGDSKAIFRTKSGSINVEVL